LAEASEEDLGSKWAVMPMMIMMMMMMELPSSGSLLKMC
jgi:hypothetical protein